MILTPTDPCWPAALSLLTGHAAPELLAAALDGYGTRLRSLRVATVGVQPGGATVVGYDAQVQRADGTTTRETLAATTGSRIPGGAAVVAGEHAGAAVEVGVWRWPQDPALPALAHASDPRRFGATLRAAGLAHDGVPQVRVRAHRPGRRAVLEISGTGPRLFVKVLRPSAVPDLRRRHDLMAPHLPVPPILAATPDGLVVLPEQPGIPLRALLDRDAPLPAPAALDAMLDGLPGALTDLPGRRTHLQRVRHFAEVLALTALTGPEHRARLDALEAALAAAGGADPPTVAVHGDFYEAQLLADGGAVTGLLDVDTAGPGHRIDEWATLLAHLSVLALHASRPAPVRRYGAAVLAHAEHRHPRAELRPRIAAAVLGLATGPFRVQQAGWARHTLARLTLAEQWLLGG